MTSGKIINLIIILTVLVISCIAIALYLFVYSTEARFNKNVGNADRLLDAESYEQAREFYQEAFRLKPDEAYPQNQLLKIDSMLTAQQFALQYKMTLGQADSLFVFKDYENARTIYLEAARINPDDPYPFDQVSQIEVILAEATTKEPVFEGNYHIVVGVFENETNAVQMQEKLRENGFNSLIISRREFDMKAVTYGAYSNIHEAYNDLPNVRQELKSDAWVIYHRIK